MNLFPINQPTLALSISEQAICLVEIKKSWRTTKLKEIRKVDIPAGILRLSSAKPNIEDMEAFTEHLRILARPLKKPTSIALSLPDLCARTSVFDFSTFPTKPSEQAALLNWRFRQDLKLDTVQSRLSYAVYVPASIGIPSNQNNPEKVLVLGSAIRNEIVEQYERVCLELNLMPVSVSIAGLDIFDLYHRSIQDILEVENRRSPSTYAGGMFLFISHWGFAFFAFHDGCPNFVRTKAITICPDSDLMHHEADEKDPAIHDGANTFDHTEDAPHPYPSYTVTKVEKEILATIQYYLETFSQGQEDASASIANLFVVSDLEHGHKLLPTPENLRQTAEVTGVSISDIQVTQLSYAAHFNKRESRFTPDSNIWSALPGYASLRVA